MNNSDRQELSRRIGRFVLVHSYPRAEDLPPECISAMAEAERENVESSLGWFDNLHTTVFRGEPGVRYYAASIGSTERTVLPLHLVRPGFFLRRIESLGNYYTSLYQPAILDGPGAVESVGTILRTASRDSGGAQEIRLSPMDPTSAVFSTMMTAIREIGWIPFSYFQFGNWYHIVDGDWTQYLARREGAVRSTIKRKRKKFAAAGGRVEIVKDSCNIEAAIQAYSKVYARSWKKPEPYPEFVPDLIRWLAARGMLRLGIAWLVSQPIAAQIWIVNHGKASIFKLAYDEEFAEHGAGTILTAELMQLAIDSDKTTEIDYLIGDDPYKKDWMSLRRERWGIVAYNPRTIIGLSLLMLELVKRAIKRLRLRLRPAPQRLPY